MAHNQCVNLHGLPYTHYEREKRLLSKARDSACPARNMTPDRSRRSAVAVRQKPRRSNLRVNNTKRC